MSTNENESEKTYNFRIKVHDDSPKNENIIGKLKEFITERGFGWTIEEITDSTFDGLFDKLNDDFWNYASTATEDDGILRAASNAATKSVKDIVKDLNKYAKPVKYKSRLNKNTDFFFPFCAEGNKVFAKKLNNFITALKANNGDVEVTLCRQGNTCQMKIKCGQSWDAFLKDVTWNNEGNKAAQCFRELIRTEGNGDLKQQICSYKAAEGILTISWEKEQNNEENRNEKQ